MSDFINEPLCFFQLRVKRGESSLGLKPNNLARHRVDLQTSSCRLLNPTILWVRHTSLTCIHVWTWILFFEMKMMLWGVLMVFLHRSRVCGSHIRVFLQSLLHLLPEGEHGQGAPLQQPQALWKPAGTLTCTHTHRSMTHTALQVGNTSYSFVCWQKYYQKHKQRPPKPSATPSDWSEPSTEMKHSSQLLAVSRCKNVCLAKTSETLFNRFAVWFFEIVSHIVFMLTHTVYTDTHIHKTKTYKDLSFCYSTE